MFNLRKNFIKHCIVFFFEVFFFSECSNCSNFVNSLSTDLEKQQTSSDQAGVFISCHKQVGFYMLSQTTLYQTCAVICCHHEVPIKQVVLYAITIKFSSNRYFLYATTNKFRQAFIYKLSDGQSVFCFAPLTAKHHEIIKEYCIYKKQ